MLFIYFTYIDSLEAVRLVTEESGSFLLNNWGLVNWSDHYD